MDQIESILRILAASENPILVQQAQRKTCQNAK